jgi:uncharacterized protein YbjT (DUF2867 family)
MQKQVILVAGGTGFVGKRVVALLEKRHQVIVYHRGHKAVPTHADVIINLIGIIREDEESFKEAHVEMTKWLVRLGKKLKIRQFVQLSALGVEKQVTNYQKTKYEAEQIVQKAGLPYAIIRPSMIFGAEDKSINRFRAIARTGFFPLLGNGAVQPVSVDTVAAVIAAAAEGRIKNRIAEVGGPEILTQEQLLDRIHPGVRIVKMPQFKVKTLTFFGEWFKSLPTQEQVVMLRQNSTTKDKTVERLKIKNPRLK